MARAGQIILFQFPQTDLRPGKLRPALIVGKLPGPFDDVVKAADADFARSGLKNDSLNRTGRLAAVDVSMLLGAIGEIDASRLARLKSNLANWLNSR